MTIAEKFAQLRSRDEKALIAFITAGDPSLEDLPGIISMLVEAGVDILEIGVPFSDPIADGPTIQASSQRALDRGVRPGAIVESLKGMEVPIPIVLMGYYNTAHRRGLAAYAQELRSAGASGTIMCDLIPEEGDDWIAASHSAGLDTVFLAAPTSTPDRLAQVCRVSTGFLYAVSRTGVTGAQSQTSSDARGLVTSLKAMTEVPVCVGFGISSPDQVREVCECADGAVVGSWLVDLLAREWKSGEGAASIGAQVAALKSATRS